MYLCIYIYVFPSDCLSVASSLTVPAGSHSTSSLNLSGLSSSLSSHALRHRPKDELPTAENSADDLDNLDDVNFCLITFF